MRADISLFESLSGCAKDVTCFNSLSRRFVVRRAGVKNSNNRVEGAHSYYRSGPGIPKFGTIEFHQDSMDARDDDMALEQFIAKWNRDPHLRAQFGNDIENALPWFDLDDDFVKSREKELMSERARRAA